MSGSTRCRLLLYSRIYRGLFMDLHLASASLSRKKLLTDAGIPFVVIEHDANEDLCDKAQPLHELVQQVALLKMAHVRMPVKGTKAFVLTADTLCLDVHGCVQGKPVNYEHACAMIRAFRDGVASTGTGFCIEYREHDGFCWHTQRQIVGYACAEYVINIPDDQINTYFAKLKDQDGLVYLNLAGAFSITGYGAQFLKELNGSYSTIVGLPMYQVRQALDEIGFFKS